MARINQLVNSNTLNATDVLAKDAASGGTTNKITAANLASGIKTIGSLVNITEMNAAIAQSTARNNDAPYGSEVDITNYTSDPFVFPHDGYVMVSSGESSSGIIRVAINSKSDGVKPYIYMNVTGVYQIQSLFVKKGMMAHVVGNTTSGGRVYYWPLTQYTP